MIHYFGGGDELPTSASFVDEDANWWAGVQKCGAILALATAAFLNSASAVQAQSVANSWQDDPAGNLTATVDEYFWQNPVAPVPGYAPPQLFLDDQVIVPQPPPFQPDEDYWPLQPQQQQQFLFPKALTDDDIIVPQPPPLHIDEFYWFYPVAQMAGQSNYMQLPFLDRDEIPAGSLFVPVQTQNYLATGVPNYLEQSIGTGIRF